MRLKMKEFDKNIEIDFLINELISTNEFDKNIEIDFLINELISTNERIDNNMEIPNDYEEKRKLLRALMKH